MKWSDFMGTAIAAEVERTAVYFRSQGFAWDRPTLRCSNCGRIQFIHKSHSCAVCGCAFPNNWESSDDPVSRQEIAAESEGFSRRICTRLRDLRQLRGMSQEEVAQRVPCVRTYITKYENGFLVPRLPMLDKLAPALGVALRELLDESIAVEQLAVDYGDGVIAQMLGYVRQLDSTSRYVIAQTARGLMRRQRPFRWLR